MHERPSQLLGLASDSYEAYCLDEAVIYFGLMVESELDEAAQGKKSREQRRAEQARKRVMDRILGEEDQKKQGSSSFADPAQMFR